MTAGRLLWVWLFSVTITAGAATALHDYAPRLQDHWLAGVDTPVVVLGSSLTHFGISPSSDGSAFSLTADGRAHTRRGIAALTERESLDMLRASIMAGAETILLEANTFIVDLQHVNQARLEKMKIGAIAGQIFAFSRSVRTGMRTLIGLGPDFDLRFIGELQGTDHQFILDPTKLKRDHPLVVHPPRHFDEMRALIELAQQGGSEIILFAPPRPETSVSIIGLETIEAAREQLDNMAAQLDVPVFSPARTWPDSYFIDHSHLNIRGRQRFMAEFSSWMAQHP